MFFRGVIAAAVVVVFAGMFLLLHSQKAECYILIALYLSANVCALPNATFLFAVVVRLRCIFSCCCGYYCCYYYRQFAAGKYCFTRCVCVYNVLLFVYRLTQKILN